MAENIKKLLTTNQLQEAQKTSYWIKTKQQYKTTTRHVETSYSIVENLRQSKKKHENSQRKISTFPTQERGKDSQIAIPSKKKKKK